MSKKRGKNKFRWMNRHHRQLEGHQRGKKTLLFRPLADDPVLFDEWAAKKRFRDQAKNEKKKQKEREAGSPEEGQRVKLNFSSFENDLYLS